MRTSRISRDTAQVVGVLSPTCSTRATRRSLRSLAHDGSATPLPDTGEASVPAATNNALSAAGSALGKRKRGRADVVVSNGIKQEEGAEPKPAFSSTANPTRRSPRKTPHSSSLANDTDESDGTAPRPRKPRRQPAKRINGPNGTISVSPPANWEEVYNITARMRSRIVAPVDTMGCESLAEEAAPPKVQRLQTLVSLMLSSQTKDTVTAVAMRRLQKELPGGFNLETLLTVEPETLNGLIEKVGFHNNKTKFIKATAVILRDQHEGDIPDTIEGLIALPGVGPKMAYLCMSAAWGRDEGIGVDVHVHRITNLWGWHKTSTPEQTRGELEAWLPREKWHQINHLLVGLGQTVCLPIGRRCGECDLSKHGLCPSAVASSPVKKRVKKELEVKVEDGYVVKNEEVKVESDDVGIKIEADIDGESRVSIGTLEPGQRPSSS